MNLIRDVLDKQLIDRNNQKMGKVDGLVMVLSEGAPPRVAYIEVGAMTLARRLNLRLGRWVARLCGKWGGARHVEPFRIPWAKVVVTGTDVTVGLDAEETPVRDWQKWLRRNVIERIPGAS
jgi:hypothetical protein